MSAADTGAAAAAVGKTDIREVLHPRLPGAFGDQRAQGADGDERVPAGLDELPAGRQMEFFFALAELEHIAQDGHPSSGLEGAQPLERGGQCPGAGVIRIVDQPDPPAQRGLSAPLLRSGRSPAMPSTMTPNGTPSAAQAPTAASRLSTYSS